MKILHVINSLATGGAEKSIAETLPLYAEQGITVDLLLLNGVEHPFLKELKQKKCCRIFSLGKTSVYNPLLIFRIIPYLKNYDLVHVHLFPAQYFVVLAKLFSNSKTKLVFTEHSTSNRRFRNKLFKILDTLIYSQYAAIIAITQSVKEKVMVHTRKKDSHIVVIENGISLEKIKNARAIQRKNISLKLGESDFLLLQVSSFQEPKDQPTVIKALQFLPAHFKLLLVGDGQLIGNCKNLVTNLKLENRVLFLRIRNDVSNLLKTADTMVLSSKYEGLSLSSIEGMASGKPFIASDVPGLTEIVKDAGILFPLGDAEKLAEEILHLSHDKNLYDLIAAQCLKRAQDFEISKMVEKHIQLYRELCS